MASLRTKQRTGRLLLGVILVGLMGVGAIVFVVMGNRSDGVISESVSEQVFYMQRSWGELGVVIAVEISEGGYTLTSGLVSLLLRSYQAAISGDEIVEVQEGLLSRAIEILGEPPSPLAVASHSASSGKTVVYGAAFDHNWRALDHSATTGSAQDVTNLHFEALEWFRQQLYPDDGDYYVRVIVIEKIVNEATFAGREVAGWTLAGDVILGRKVIVQIADIRYGPEIVLGRQYRIVGQVSSKNPLTVTMPDVQGIRPNIPYGD